MKKRISKSIDNKVKYAITMFVILICQLLIANLRAQTPQAVPYQGVARNAGGNIIANQNISLQLSIHDVTATGTVVFKETHNATTNTLGLFSVNIGQGTAVTGTLSGVNWGSGAKYLQIEFDPAGGNLFTDMGTTQLNSVPYALYAENANVPGVAGPQGPIGLTGATGATGLQGAIGLTGATGAQGPIGLTGNDGATGPQGPIGLTGAIGATGPQGPIGLTGPQGSAGNDGAIGPQGSIGLTGSQGPIGLTGNDGATGAQGPAGNDGATGATGSQGLTGATGQQGPVGATGAQGTQGNPGPAPSGTGIVTVNGGVIGTPAGLTGDITTTGSGLVTAISAGAIVNADINTAAAIGRTKLAPGTANHVIINDGSGVLSSEATLAVSLGGTGSSTQNFVDLTTTQTSVGNKTWSGKATFSSIDGLLASGTYASGTIPATGGGVRMMWYPKKAAFRAGYVSGTQWDDANIGQLSIALGYDAKASGDYSTAMGAFAIASGNYSTAMGNTTTASGNNSTAMGLSTIASGLQSTAMGQQTTATGTNSTAMGFVTTASGDYSTAMGTYASTNGQSGSFVYGDNSSAGAVLNAAVANQFIVRAAGGYKFHSDSNLTKANTMVFVGGNLGMGTFTPAAKIDVVGTTKTTGFQMPTGAGAGRILTSDSIGVASWGSIDASGLFSTIPEVNLYCPVVTGSVASNLPSGVALSGNYAYVVNEQNSTMQVINITNPAAPVVAGTVATGAGPIAIAVSGNYAYVLNNTSVTMQVINIANPAAPVVVGSISTGASGSAPKSVAVSGNYAYVVSFYGFNLLVINIANPAVPVLVGSVTTGFGPNSVVVSGNYAYVVNTNSSSMQIIDIINPAAPLIKSTVVTAAQPQSIAVSGNYAYVASLSGNNFQVINITNPSAPVVAGSLALGTAAGSVAVSGNYVFVTQSVNDIMKVINIVDPAAPYIVGSVSTGDAPVSIAVSGAYAYVTNQQSHTMQVIGLACDQTFSPIYDPATGQITATVSQWNTTGNDISNNNFGKVGIGTSNPTQKFQVYNGTSTGSYTTSGWVHSSDERLKTNIKPLQNSLFKILQLNGVSYNWKTLPESNPQIGFIAQEAEKIFPEVVVKDKDGNYGMAYQNLVAPMVQAMQEQQEQIESLKAENKKLIEENTTFKSDISKIKTQLGIK